MTADLTLEELVAACQRLGFTVGVSLEPQRGAESVEAERDALRAELERLRHAAEVNRDMAAVLGFEAGMREVEAERNALRAENERLRAAIMSVLAEVDAWGWARNEYAGALADLVRALSPAPQEGE